MVPSHLPERSAAPPNSEFASHRHHPCCSLTTWGAPPMSLQLHERGTHAVCTGGTGQLGLVSLVEGTCSGPQARSEAHVTSQPRAAEFAELPGPPGGAGPVSPEARHWLGQITIERPVLELRPDYTALIIVAEGLRPGPSDEATDALLADAEAQATATLAGRDPGELAPVAAWRAAYQAFGAKPKRTRPSVEALLRRVEAGCPGSTGSRTSTTRSRSGTCCLSAGRTSPSTAGRRG